MKPKNQQLPWTDERLQIAIDLLQHNFSLTQTASEMCISRMALQTALVRHGIVLKKKWVIERIGS